MASDDLTSGPTQFAGSDSVGGRFVPDPELGLGGRLCRTVAALQRVAAQHNLQGIRRTAKDLRALAIQFRLEGLAWHAQALHDLEFADANAQVRLYELLDGTEAALEHTLDRLRLH